MSLTLRFRTSTAVNEVLDAREGCISGQVKWKIRPPKQSVLEMVLRVMV